MTEDARMRVAVDLVLMLAAKGVTYEVKGGNLVVTPKERLTPGVIGRIKQYKAELIELYAEWLAELEDERIAIQEE